MSRICPDAASAPVAAKAAIYSTLAVIILSSAASAQTNPFATLANGMVTSELSIGVLNGKAQEFVYNPNGSVLSRLDWRIKNVAMFNTQSTYRPFPWLSFGVKGSTNLSGRATNDDYDFDAGVGCPIISGHELCHSASPTKLQQAYRGDLYGSAQFVKINGITVDAQAGYKRDTYKWQDNGGSANYATLPPGAGITYEQTWSTPYLGLAAAFESGPWSVNGRVVGSAWAKGRDRDQHHLRGLVFEENFNRSSFIGADLAGAYRLTPATSLTVGYSYQNWRIAKGDTLVTGLGGSQLITGDAAGANNVSHALTLGVKVELGTAPIFAAGGAVDTNPRPVAWGGWYGGLTSGYDWQRDRWQTTSLAQGTFTPEPTTAQRDLNVRGNRVAGFAGYAWQTGPMIWGIEADLAHSNGSSITTGVPGYGTAIVMPFSGDVVTINNGFDGSLRGRIGTPLTPSLIVYGTAGLAVQQMSAQLSCPGASSTSSWCIADRLEKFQTTKLGLTAGAGYESQYAGNWFTRGEYRYTRLGSISHTYFADVPVDAVAAKIDANSHRLSFGLGYRF